MCMGRCWGGIGEPTLLVEDDEPVLNAAGGGGGVYEVILSQSTSLITSF